MTNATDTNASVCQHCHQPVSFDRKPLDAGYAAFTHDATRTVACPKP